MAIFCLIKVFRHRVETASSLWGSFPVLGVLLVQAVPAQELDEQTAHQRQ
jgi:hypothetical protein